MLLARSLDKRDQGHEACVADYTQAFLNAEVREGEQLYAQPPEALAGTLVEQVERTRLRDRCLFVNTELHICIGVHVDDMLAVVLVN